MERKAQLQRIISKGKTNYIATAMAIYSIIFSVVLLVGALLGAGSIPGVNWILFAMITFYLAATFMMASTKWQKLNEEYKGLK